MYELLLELKQRLNQIAIVGVGSAVSDFRLKKLEEKLKMLSSKAPVLAKLYELVSKLISGNEVIATFMELNSLVEAILSTQGTSKPEGEEKVLTLYEHQSECNLTFAQLQEVRNILNGGTNTKWANLKRAYLEGKLFDFRLLEDFLEHIGDNYEYIDYYDIVPNDERKPFSMQVILEQFGKDIIPILLDRFDHMNALEKANAIKLIYRLGGEAYNDYYRKWVEDEVDDNVIAQALGSLGSCVENEAFLLSYKTRKKKLQEARVMSLAYILKTRVCEGEDGVLWDETQLASETMQEIRKYCLKDNEFFIRVFKEVPFYNEKEYIELLFNTVQKVKDSSEFKGTNLYRNNAFCFLRGIIWLLEHYTGETAVTTIKALIEFESDDKKLCFEASIGSHLFADYLAASKHPECMKYLASLGEQYGGYYITDSFVAALKLYTPEQVYDTFMNLAYKKYPKVDKTIIKMLEESVEYDFLVNSYTGKKPNRYYTYNEEHMIVNGNRRAYIHRDNITWDRRWLKAAQSYNSVILMLHFVIRCLKEKERTEYKKFFVDRLKAWKKEMGSEEYTQYTNMSRAKRDEYVTELVSLVTGLCITGAKEEAVSCIDYFVSHLDVLKNALQINLNTEDLKYIDEVEARLESFTENKRNVIKAFIDELKNVLKNR